MKERLAWSLKVKEGRKDKNYSTQSTSFVGAGGEANLSLMTNETYPISSFISSSEWHYFFPFQRKPEIRWLVRGVIGEAGSIGYFLYKWVFIVEQELIEFKGKIGIYSIFFQI